MKIKSSYISTKDEKRNGTIIKQGFDLLNQKVCKFHVKGKSWYIFPLIHLCIKKPDKANNFIHKNCNSVL